MHTSPEFLHHVLDSVTDHIAVIDESGAIVFANNSWTTFFDENSATAIDRWYDWNYLDECDKASAAGDPFGARAGDGIRSVIDNRCEAFYFEYPCHGPDEERWFMMRVTRFEMLEQRFFVVAHQNITERKLAEECAERRAKVDGLTGIPNRRTFDEFLFDEWRRCRRLQSPISLAIVDLDHFKLLNDRYGHQAGDDSLIQVGAALASFASRPGDLCARLGGEEFALLWGDTGLVQARDLCMDVLHAIERLAIPNLGSPTYPHLTASIGVASVTPCGKSSERLLIENADQRLYEAKNNGRNRVEG